jgi:hypothetical protein
MSQVKTKRRAKNVQFVVENGQASAPAMLFQAQVGAQRQADGVTLRPLQAKLPTLNPRKLLQRPMRYLDQPSTVSQELALRLRHGQAISRPVVVVRVAGWVNRPKVP